MELNLQLLPVIWELIVEENLFLINSALTIENNIDLHLTAAIIREKHIRMFMNEFVWLDNYNNTVFYELFKLKKSTFQKLLENLLRIDRKRILQKPYRGGRKPLTPEKSLLMFLWYINYQSTLNEIADRFDVVRSTVMNDVNNILYLMLQIKNNYTYWPKSREDYMYISRGFSRYPRTIGAVDGTHIEITIRPVNQQDSYINRKLRRSINLMAICTAERLFTYVFIGFPGSAHDSRVFANSNFVNTIERHGSGRLFPHEDYHILGDSAFPLRQWLMKPYPTTGLNRIQAYHNYLLSAERVCIENTFGLLKGRYHRLKYINTYSISKSIEIVTAACVLHNFCYRNGDFWEEVDVHIEEGNNAVNLMEDDATARRKINYISEELWRHR